MASTVAVDKIQGASGTTVTIPTGHTLAVTDGIGISSLPTITVAKGGTGSTSASAARTALGVAIGSDVQAFDADLVAKDTNNTFTKAQRGSTQTANATGSTTLDFDLYQNFVLTLTGNLTLANPSTESVGQSGVIVIIQDGTGSRTLSLGTDYETAGGAGLTISTAANAVDVIPYFVKASGSIQLGAPQLAFA
jgi:hypothetical protein